MSGRDDRLTHLDAQGRARMVDVTDKDATHRRAVAEGRIVMAASTLERIVAGDTPKGDVHLDEALEIVRGHARKDADGKFAYLAASLHALEGRRKDAVAALDKAVAADPTNRVRAFHDADFAELRKDQEHAHLFGLD
jgi:hypothetical protein